MSLSDSALLSNQQKQQRHALVVCDMQPDFVKSIVPDSRRAALIDAVQISVHAARQANWQVVFASLQFASGYQGVSPNDKLYGAFQRLNQKLGDAQVHWFMEGYDGSEILPSLVTAASSSDNDDTQTNDDDNTPSCTINRRQQHLPSPELLQLLQNQDITHVTVIGCKAAYSIQATCQVLCNAGMVVTVVKESIGDDDVGRLSSIMTHLIPIYANVVNLVDFIDEAIGIEEYVDRKKTIADKQDFDNSLVKYWCDCGRGGHAPMYMHHLLQREEWQPFPRQQWYINFLNTFFCPLGKRVVQFCDEPQFSQTSMFLKGREWLDEKEKLVELAGEAMPRTFLIKRRKWIGETPSALLNGGDDDSNLCWFVKEVNKNGGRAVQMCKTVEECMALTEPDECYVVQQHIADPFLTDDGRKCHIKFYSLLQCNAQGLWQLYTYKEAFLSTSPNQWSPDDVSSETQITIKRDKRLRLGEAVDEWKNQESMTWPSVYVKCKETVEDIVGRAVEQGKLQTRPGQEQFEIFSADFMLDTSGKLWIIEFNFTPVLYDPDFANEDNLTTPGLKRYHDLYLKQGEKAQVNDGDMIRDAVTIAFYDSKGLPATTKWDAAGRFQSRGSDGGVDDDEKISGVRVG